MLSVDACLTESGLKRKCDRCARPSMPMQCHHYGTSRSSRSPATACGRVRMYVSVSCSACQCERQVAGVAIGSSRTRSRPVAVLRPTAIDDSNAGESRRSEGATNRVVATQPVFTGLGWRRGGRRHPSNIGPVPAVGVGHHGNRPRRGRAQGHRDLQSVLPHGRTSRS